MGPASDETGVEQGGVSSSDFYKIYNNEQFNTLQSSNLGVNIGSTIVTAVGQADDPVQLSNDIFDLQCQLLLTEKYCDKYKVTLVPSKTKLFVFSSKKHKLGVEYSGVINDIKIGGQNINFVSEAEHVGVLRHTSGNMPHILSRISAHKRSLFSLMSVGLARGHTGSVAANLRVENCYAEPVLFSGVASLYLKKKELKTLGDHHKITLLRIQKLHKRTPRAAVFYLAGRLPGEALLHLRQLSLFSMICRLPADPLNTHARYILSLPAGPPVCSWFLQIKSICNLYCLPHPLALLQDPLPKDKFKVMVKSKVLQYWHNKLQDEAASLPSLQYLQAPFLSLTRCHPLWSTMNTSSYQVNQATVQAIMLSGRYRTEYLCRHWSDNHYGYCRTGSCDQVEEQLEHILFHCPMLHNTRQYMFSIWMEKTIYYPALQNIIRRVIVSSPATFCQFVLDLSVTPDIIKLQQIEGSQILTEVFSLTRSFSFSLHRTRLISLGRWRGSTTNISIYRDRQYFTDHINNTRPNILITGIQSQETNPSSAPDRPLVSTAVLQTAVLFPVLPLPSSPAPPPRPRVMGPVPHLTTYQ